MLDEKTRKEIRDAFKAGQLKVKAADRETGEIALYPISDVMRHHTPHKKMVDVTVNLAGQSQSVVCTEDHSLFTSEGRKLVPVAAGELDTGSSIIAALGGEIVAPLVTSLKEAPPEEYTYDLCVPGPENFFLANGILAHNSYSIGGVSLDIEKSSKYESLKQNAEGQFEKATETKMMTVKFIRGLRQPKYGVGIRSAFGSHVGRGVLSPRNFL